MQFVRVAFIDHCWLLCRQPDEYPSRSNPNALASATATAYLFFFPPPFSLIEIGLDMIQDPERGRKFKPSF